MAFFKNEYQRQNDQLNNEVQWPRNRDTGELIDIPSTNYLSPEEIISRAEDIANDDDLEIEEVISLLIQSSGDEIDG